MSAKSREHIFPCKAKTFARIYEISMRTLLSRVLENEEAPFNQPVKAIRIKQAVIMRTPAFQAG